ncbi:hypothetical protein KM043_016345 [Ampulex compressa]|nr:hypothetical protein KM043_016345 [Ampulex compressa]
MNLVLYLITHDNENVPSKNNNDVASGDSYYRPIEDQEISDDRSRNSPSSPTVPRTKTSEFLRLRIRAPPVSSLKEPSDQRQGGRETRRQISRRNYEGPLRVFLSPKKNSGPHHVCLITG